jgi:uroporphyrinogen decarboxylase
LALDLFFGCFHGVHVTEPPNVNDIFLRAARGERTERTPIWLMRQAGRTDPEYNRLRESCGLTLEKLFRHAELAAEISLLPKRIGVDAIIYFQDILTPLSPMGADFVFVPGPQIPEPVRTEAQMDALTLYDVAQELPFIPETFRRVKSALRGELPVLGFAGAPLTLAVFLMEGRSFGQSAPTSLEIIARSPKAVHRLLDKLATMTIDYLTLQIEAGASAVQLFESAAFLFSPAQYAEFALPYQRRIFDTIRGRVTTIMFAHNWHNLLDLKAAGADIVSLPNSTTIEAARSVLGDAHVLQGNFDNKLLVTGTKEAITEAALACVASGKSRGHIFNLNHGLLRETPFENVVHLVQTVRSAKVDAASSPRAG